jgi:hypothetical protein
MRMMYECLDSVDDRSRLATRRAAAVHPDFWILDRDGTS